MISLPGQRLAGQILSPLQRLAGQIRNLPDAGVPVEPKKPLPELEAHETLRESPLETRQDDQVCV